MSPVGWGTELDESSGLIDDFDFTIGGAGFKYDQAYGDGTALFLSLTGRTNDPDQPETEVRLSTGSHWETKDGGKSIVRDDGKEQMPNKNSMLGKWMNRMINDFGLLELMESRGHPLSAAPWVGLKIHVKREKAEYEGLDQKGPKPMPEKFLGVVDGTTGAVAAEAAGVAAPAAAAAPTGETAAEAMARLKAQAAGNGGGGSLKDQAIAIIKEAPDFASAQEKVLGLDGIAADDALLSTLLDDGPGSLWAEVRG
jgi:hypothetical protein